MSIIAAPCSLHPQHKGANNVLGWILEITLLLSYALKLTFDAPLTFFVFFSP